MWNIYGLGLLCRCLIYVIIACVTYGHSVVFSVTCLPNYLLHFIFTSMSTYQRLKLLFTRFTNHFKHFRLTNDSPFLLLLYLFAIS